MPSNLPPVVNGQIIEALHVNQFRDPINNLETGTTFYYSDAGADDDYAVTIPNLEPPASLPPGLMVNLKLAAGNTGPATLAVNGRAPMPITKNGVQPLVTGDILPGQVVTLVYDGANFQLMSGSAGEVPVARQILTTSPLQGGGDLSADRTLSMPAAGAGSSGYLTQTDWNTFNSKAAGNHSHNLQDLGGVLPADKGGTGQSSYTAGDLLHATGASALGKLPIGANGQVLKVVSGAPAWANESGGAQSLDDLTDVTLSAPTAGQILRYVDAISGFTNQALNTGIVPEGSNLYYTDARARGALSALAPMAYNPGTGQFSMPQAGAAQSGYLSSSDWTIFNNKTGVGHTHDAGDIANGILGVLRGGTGLDSFVGGDLLYATGAAALGRLGLGLPGEVLRVNPAGTAPEWGEGSGGSVTLADIPPEVVGVATGASGTSNVTSHPITLPTGIQKGDLLVIFFSSDGGVFCSCAGWSKAREGSQGANVTGAVFYKVAEGGDSATVVTSAAEQSSHIVYQLRLWPGWSRVLAADAASGSSGNANPPSLAFGVTGSGLVIASRHGDATEVATGAPAGYSSLQTSTASGTAGASTNTAVKFVDSVSAEDPGAFSGDSLEQWAAFTVFIPALPLDAGSLEVPPGTGTNDSSYGSIAWSTPENILASDNSRASMAASGTTPSHYLKASNFGLSIPEGATILSLTIGTEVLRNGGTVGHIVDDTLKLVVGGTVVGNNLATATTWPNSDTLKLYGGALSTWGVSPTPAELNASDFGVVLSARGQSAGHDRVANVDRIFVIVNYVLTRSEAIPFNGDLSDIASVSVAKGTLLAGSADGWRGLPAGSNGQLLVADSAEASGVKWSSLPAHEHAAGDITSGVLGVPRGGTGLGSYTPGSFIRAATASSLEERTPSQVLTDINASAVGHSHGAGDIVSGVLGVSFGGTGINAYTTGNYIRAASGSTLEQRTPAQVRADIDAAQTSHQHDAGAITSGFLGVTRGGTGLNSVALGDLVYSNAADSLARLAGNISTTRQFLRQTGTGIASAAPAWDTLQAGDLPAHNHSASEIASGVLGTSRGGTGLGTYAIGDILYASAADTLARLAAGSNGQVLTLAGGAPSWATPSAGLDGAGLASALAYWSDANTLTYDSAITRTGAGVLRANTRLEAAEVAVTSTSGVDTTGAFDLNLNRNTIEVARFGSDRTFLRKVRNLGGGYNLYWGGSNVDEVVWLASRRAHKKDVADLQLTMDDLMSWRPVQYQWRTAFGGDLDVGLIAEEMAGTFPRVVIHDRDWVYTNPETGDYQRSPEGGPLTLPGTSVPTGIKYDRAWVALLAGVQDFYRNYLSTIQSLSARVRALESGL